MNAAAAASNAAHEASAVKRAVSPPAISPRLEPIKREMADVTLTAVCRELQKSQNTKPEKRTAYKPACTGKPASEASASALGRR